MNITKLFYYLLIMIGLSLSITVSAKMIEADEYAFIKQYSGKSKTFIAKALGKPKKKERAVKPQNADAMLAKNDVAPTGTKKKDMVEMWYYDAKIKYASKRYFNHAELTFVNDKCVNITFANKKK